MDAGGVDVDIIDCDTTRDGGWLVIEIDRLAEVHIVPKNDIVRHLVGEDCICGPTVERIECLDGADGWMYSHSSLDGREIHE